MKKQDTDISSLKGISTFHHIPREGRQLRMYSTASAAEAIGELHPDIEVFVLTLGQFSLFDAMEVILDRTGPADVIVATWTAAGADTKRAREFVDHGYIRRMRWIVDRSFRSRQAQYCELLESLFSGCIRTLRTHAKFVCVSNESAAYVLRTSMNFNSNPRCEDLEISGSREFAEFFVTWTDMVFQKTSDGDNYNSEGGLAEVCEGMRSTSPTFTMVADRGFTL